MTFFYNFVEVTLKTMDIDLLSKMIKELILDKDEVALPGVGTFVAEIVPSTFSDKGYTINPPYRRLSFRQRLSEEDNSLAAFYASSNNLDSENAKRIIEDFLSEMKDVLKEKKTIVFPGLGRLRATRENNFFFVADEDLDIYPAGFGLEPISLKTHEESPEVVSAAVASLKGIISESVETEVSMETDAPIETQTNNSVENEVSNEAVVPPMETQINNSTESTIAPTTEHETTGPDTSEELIAEPTSITPTEPEIQEEDRNEKVLRNHIHEAEYYDYSDEHTSSINSIMVLKVILICIAIVIVALIVFVLLARIAPDFIDNLLYTKEELEIIRY